LINGLGHHLATGGPFEQSTEAQWQALYEVNLLHVFRVTQAFVPGMKERGWGRIVNFSSVEGVRSAPALAVYASFKRAIDGFTKSLAVDLARYGILVNALGVDKTKAYQVGFYELPPEYEDLVGTFIPAGRYADGLDVAKAALFLASDLNTWAVGHTLITDGGTLAAGGWFRTPKRWTNQPLLTQYIEKDPAINERRPPMVQ
jgi:NAD(P)-dependent dehydrogenase (short-subunit alcohol dehydrogenase family)